MSIEMTAIAAVSIGQPLTRLNTLRLVKIVERATERLLLSRVNGRIRSDDALRSLENVNARL
jgi:hypothetical protein